MDNTNGMITLARQILKWRWWDDNTVVKLWITLLLVANWQDGDCMDMTIKRGQTFRSIRTLALESGLTEKQVRGALDKLKKTGEISTKRASKGIIITLEKYSDYQLSPNYAGQSKGQSDVQSNVQTEGNNIINKEYNNISLSKDKEIMSGKPDPAPKKGKALTESCKVIITHLNETTGSRYKTNAKYIRDLIGARLVDGYTVEDFITVIDRQVLKWGNDPKMAEYLRPKTLFRPSNFDSYLNAPATEEELKKEKAKEKAQHNKEQLRIETAQLNKIKEYLNNDPDNKELLKAYRDQKVKVEWLGGTA